MIAEVLSQTKPRVNIHDSSTETTATCISNVLQTFRFTYETIAEASYSDTTVYTGNLQSLLRMICVANTEPQPRLLQKLRM